MRLGKLIVAVLACTPAMAVVVLGVGQPRGYLPSGSFDAIRLVAPAPRAGDPRDIADRRLFRATRGLAGTARWAMARRDAAADTFSLMRDFSCAAGAALTPQGAPRLTVLLERASADMAAQIDAAKERYRRPRPFAVDHGAICQPAAELYDGGTRRLTYDYPSGHAGSGWTWALILAGLAPDRAAAVLARGRAFGDSRIVCGVHSASAVAAGRAIAAATLRRVRATAAYRSDHAAASIELAGLRRRGGRPTGCAAEAALIAQPIGSAAAAAASTRR